MMNLNHIFFEGVDPVAPTRLPVAAVGFPRLATRLPHPIVRPQVTAPGAHPDFELFLSWILQHAGIQPSGYQNKSMHRRIGACLRKLRVTTIAEARALLGHRPHLLPQALDALLIGVSDFFRDADVFERIETGVIPELLRTRSGLRIASAGASRGQELYSMAMLVGDAGALDRSQFVGIDVRTEAIQAARQGCFSAEEIAGIKAARRDRYLVREGTNWRVQEVVRQRMTWQCRDLFSLDQNTMFDVILFRNVAIYFDGHQASSVWNALASMLVPGGFLITGKAEKPPHTLGLTRVASCIYKVR